MTLRVCFYSCIFLFSHFLWAGTNTPVGVSSSSGAKQKFILKDAEIQIIESKSTSFEKAPVATPTATPVGKITEAVEEEIKIPEESDPSVEATSGSSPKDNTEPSGDTNGETKAASSLEVLMPEPVQKILLRDAEIKMKLSERIFIRRKIDFSYVSWQENIKANLNSNSVVLNLQVEGLHLGGNWIVGTNRWQFIVEGFGEALTTIATEDSPALTFRQKSVAAYAIGTGIIWPFFYTPGASMIGIGVRARGRIVDLQKPSSQDSFSGRETVLTSLEIPASWRIAERWAINESLGFSFRDSATFFQLGVQWSFR
jgi:hypothetical protein